MEHSSALYQAFKQSNDIMFYADKNGVILDVNEAFTRHYGYTRKEAVGKTPRILRSRHSTKEFYARMWAGILDPKKGYWRGEIVNKAKDGREIPLVLTISAIRGPEARIEGFISNALDMSEQVALQQRVAQSEALATLGEMAAVLAHEIRNPLGSIVMAAKQMAAGGLGAADQDMVLGVLRGEAQRLNETLSNFLAYARPRKLKLERRNLNHLVEEVANIVGSNRALLKDSRLRFEFDAALKPLPMDGDQIRQVLWNIVLNGLQAMEGRGILTITTGHQNGWSYFRIDDTGPGISEAALVDLFKPFHTSKQQGTGLGLAIADRIVKTHGGRIEVQNRPGRGAAFTVYLPSIED